MPNQELSAQESEIAARGPFITIDDCIESAEELVARLSCLGAQKYPLYVRKGVRASVTNNQPSGTLKVSSRTYFFDVKTSIGVNRRMWRRMWCRRW
jgi:hypothetical protein